MLRKIIGPRMEAVTRDWTSLHNEELFDLYSSQNIIQVIKPQGEEMGRVWGRRYLYRFQFGNLKQRDHLEDLGINGRKPSRS
jgi:hypothetical protein